MINLTINGTIYPYPENQDEDWGVNATAWAEAITNLTANLRIPTNPIANAEVIRLGHEDKIAWRDAGDTDNYTLYASSGSLLFYDGTTTINITGLSGGNVQNTVGSTDNALARYDGASGVIIQNSAGILDDSGNLTGLTSVDATTLLEGGVGVIKDMGTPADNCIVRADGTTGLLVQPSSVFIDDSNNVTIGDGTSSSTDPNLVIDSDTGDATIRLQLNNSSSTAWDIRADNSNTNDDLKIEFNGSEVAQIDHVNSLIGITSNSGSTSASFTAVNTTTGDADLTLSVNNGANEWKVINDNSDNDYLKLNYNGSDAVIVSRDVSKPITIAAADVSSSATPVANTLYANTFVKAWGALQLGTSPAVTVLGGFNIASAVWDSGTDRITVTFNTAMANANYALSSTLYVSGVDITLVTKSTTQFIVAGVPGLSSGQFFDFILIGAQ